MHHFAHQSGAECELGYITSLHYAAKEILSKTKVFVIPDVLIEFTSNKEPLKLNKTNKVVVNNVELVYSPESRIPDIVIESQEKKLYVIFSFSNSKDLHYKNRFEIEKKSAIEIDISSWKTLIDKDDLTEIITSDACIKHWIYNDAAQIKREKIFEYAKSLKVCKIGFKDYRIYDCPLKIRFDGERTFAFEDDCENCQFCVGYNFLRSDFSYCTCENLVSDLEDINISYEQRKKKYEYYYSLSIE